jgi:hypothetical protein
MLPNFGLGVADVLNPGGHEVPSHANPYSARHIVVRGLLGFDMWYPF